VVSPVVQSGVCAKLVKQYSNNHGRDVQGGGGQSGAAPAGPSLLEPTGAAQQSAPAAQRSAQTLSLRSETPSPDQAQMSTHAVDAAAQKPTSVDRHPTDSTHRPSAVSDNDAEPNTAVVDTSEQQLAGMPLPRPGKRSSSDTTCQVNGAFGDSRMQLLGPIKVHD